MEQLFSNRSLNTKPSFVREILKYAQSDTVISFAGGLPNPIAIPTDALAESSDRVIRDYGYKVFQYSNSEGLYALREQICNRYYERFQLRITPVDILITTGSQQGNDLLGKAVLNHGDKILVEKPAYLGALQIFSMFEPEFLTVDLEEDGPNLEQLEEILRTNEIKIFYTVPNFQNPTGITYCKEKREKLAKMLSKYDTILIEDDPYGELRFHGEDLPYIGAGKLQNSVLFGTFSKTVAPGMRVGYLCTQNHQLMKHLITAKQATDLHTDIMAQYTICDFLLHNDYDKHIQRIKDLYQIQSTTMVEEMKKAFSSEIEVTNPEGGMFLWARIKQDTSALCLFNHCIKEGVAFVPGDPFYVNLMDVSTFRLNYTNSSSDEIKEGIKRMKQGYQKYQFD